MAQMDIRFDSSINSQDAQSVSHCKYTYLQTHTFQTLCLTAYEQFWRERMHRWHDTSQSGDLDRFTSLIGVTSCHAGKLFNDVAWTTALDTVQIINVDLCFMLFIARPERPDA